MWLKYEALFLYLGETSPSLIITLFWFTSSLNVSILVPGCLTPLTPGKIILDR
jgi:hypothetical protein